MIIIHAEFKIQEDKEQAFLEEIRHLIQDSRAENGNVSYDLMKSTENKCAYTMVEVWQDMMAVESHNKSEHFTSFVNKAPQFLAASLDVKLYEGTELVK